MVTKLTHKHNHCKKQVESLRVCSHCPSPRCMSTPSKKRYNKLLRCSSHFENHSLTDTVHLPPNTFTSTYPMEYGKTQRERNFRASIRKNCSMQRVQQTTLPDDAVPDTSVASSSHEDICLANLDEHKTCHFRTVSRAPHPMCNMNTSSCTQHMITPHTFPSRYVFFALRNLSSSRPTHEGFDRAWYGFCERCDLG